MSIIGYRNLFKHFLQQFLLAFILIREFIENPSNTTCGYTSGQKQFSPIFPVDVQSDAHQDGNNSSSVVQWKEIVWTIIVRRVSSHVIFMPQPYPQQLSNICFTTDRVRLWFLRSCWGRRSD